MTLKLKISEFVSKKEGKDRCGDGVLHFQREDLGFFAVMDGMGPYDYEAKSVIEDYLNEKKENWNPDGRDMDKEIANLFVVMNKNLLYKKKELALGEDVNFGASVAIGIVQGEYFYAAHYGDSRVACMMKDKGLVISPGYSSDEEWSRGLNEGEIRFNPGYKKTILEELVKSPEVNLSDLSMAFSNENTLKKYLGKGDKISSTDVTISKIHLTRLTGFSLYSDGLRYVDDSQIASSFDSFDEENSARLLVDIARTNPDKRVVSAYGKTFSKDDESSKALLANADDISVLSVKFEGDPDIEVPIYHPIEGTFDVSEGYGKLERKFSLAMEKYHSGEYEEALGLFKEVYSSNSEDNVAHRYIGNSLKRLGKLDEAVAVYNDVLGNSREDMNVLNSLGAIEIEKGNNVSAIKLFEEASSKGSLYGKYNIQWFGDFATMDDECSALRDELMGSDKDILDEENVVCLEEARRAMDEHKYRQFSITTRHDAITIVDNLLKMDQEYPLMGPRLTKEYGILDEKVRVRFASDSLKAKALKTDFNYNDSLPLIDESSLGKFYEYTFKTAA